MCKYEEIFHQVFDIAGKVTSILAMQPLQNDAILMDTPTNLALEHLLIAGNNDFQIYGIFRRYDKMFELAFYRIPVQTARGECRMQPVIITRCNQRIAIRPVPYHKICGLIVRVVGFFFNNVDIVPQAEKIQQVTGTRRVNDNLDTGNIVYRSISYIRDIASALKIVEELFLGYLKLPRKYPL